MLRWGVIEWPVYNPPVAPIFVTCPGCGQENLQDTSETQIHEKGCRVWAGQAVPATEAPRDPDAPRTPFHDFRGLQNPVFAKTKDKPERTVPFWEAVVALVLFSTLSGVAGYYTGQDAADRYYEPLLSEAHANTASCISYGKTIKVALDDSRKDYHDLWGVVREMFHAAPGDDADKVLKKLCDTFPDGKRPSP